MIKLYYCTDCKQQKPESYMGTDDFKPRCKECEMKHNGGIDINLLIQKLKKNKIKCKKEN